MQVNVTQEHINQGVRRSSHQCPISLAFVDAGVEDASVDRLSVFLRKSKKYRTRNSVRWIVYCKELPTSAKAFIEKFDEGQPVEPFTFELEV